MTPGIGGNNPIFIKKEDFHDYFFFREFREQTERVIYYKFRHGPLSLQTWFEDGNVWQPKCQEERVRLCVTWPEYYNWENPKAVQKMKEVSKQSVGNQKGECNHLNCYSNIFIK